MVSAVGFGTQLLTEMFFFPSGSAHFAHMTFSFVFFFTQIHIQPTVQNEKIGLALIIREIPKG